MKPADAAEIQKLSAWKDRSAIPEATGTPEYEVFFDIVGSVPTWFEVDDFQETAPSLSATQRRVGAIMLFADALVWDGLITGVLLNQPEIVAHAEEAAEYLGLRNAAATIARIRELVPAEVLELKDLDQRLSWFNEHEDVSGELEQISDSEELEAVRCDLMLQGMKIIAENPAEFSVA